MLYSESQSSYYSALPKFRYPQLGFDLFVILATCCSMVCQGLLRSWFAFVWCGLSLIAQIWTFVIHFGGSKRDEYNDKNKSTSPSRRKKVLAIVVSVFKGLFMIILGLLTSGSISSVYAFSFSNPGILVNVMFDGTNYSTGSLALYCLGPKTNSTIFLTASPAHGITDFYSLQTYLTQKGRRVCSFDFLGFGHSGDPLLGQFTNSEYLMRLMTLSGEEPPYHLVGMGGVPQVAEITALYPAFVKSATFIETYPDGIEVDWYGEQKGLGGDELVKYRNEDLNLRMGLVKIILSLAIPWGLMGLFIPLSPVDPTFFPKEKWLEFRVQMWKSNSWITQLEGLKKIQSTPTSEQPLQKYAPLPVSVPVFGIYCDLGDSCYDGLKNRTGADLCADIKRKNDYYTKAKFKLLNSLNENTTVVNNTAYDCGIDMPVKKPEFTAEAILSLIKTIEV